MRLTSTEIESFVGDIVPLQLICERDISRENIAWRVAALGHYPRVVWRNLIEDGRGIPPFLAEFPVEYTISVSLDGEYYDLCDEGIFRCYGSEEILSFESRDARYVRLNVHSNAAAYKGIAEFGNCGLAIGELTLYK